MQAPSTSKLKDRVSTIPARWWTAQRWFGGKGRTLRATEVEDWGEFPLDRPALLALVVVHYATGPSERYFVPLVAVRGGEGAAGAEAEPALVWEHAGERWSLVDGLQLEAYRMRLLELLASGESLALAAGRVQFRPEAGLPSALEPGARPRLVPGEQSNSSIVLGQGLFLKCFRRAVAGVNPDVEVGRFLTVEAGFCESPAMLGSAEYQGRDGTPRAFAVAQAFVPNQGPAWPKVVAGFRSVLGGASTAGAPATELLDEARKIGALTADLHRALASAPAGHAFAPEPITRTMAGAWRDAARSGLERAHGKLAALPNPASHDPGLVAATLARWPSLEARVEGLLALGGSGAVATRIHGDYHLGQVLACDDSYQVIDFEGEPLRSIEERRAHHTPLKDVAGMLRSLAYAAQTALLGSVGADDEQVERWHVQVRGAFLDAYSRTARGAPFLPQGDLLAQVLTALEIEKAAYELEYELDNRPDWVAIPLRGLRRLARP